MPLLQFPVIALLANEGRISLFDVGGEVASQACIEVTPVDGLGLFNSLLGDQD